MRPGIGALGAVTAGLLAGMGLPAWADWAQSGDPLAVAPAPPPGQPVVQNPPSFAWSRAPGKVAGYVLEITSGATPVASYSTVRNWYLPQRALPPGRYAWRVRVAGQQNWSSPREFEVTPAAARFEVPSDSELVAAIAARAAPRSLPPGWRTLAQWPAELHAERDQAYQRLVAEVQRQQSLAPLRDADWPLRTGKVQSVANVTQNDAVRERVNLVTRQLEAAALLFRLSGERRYLDEALRRGDEVVSLDPQGPTSYVNQDQATRQIALSLSKALDYLADELDSERRTRWRHNVALRAGSIYADLSQDAGRLDQSPLDSHGGTNVAFLALIAALNLGQIAPAQAWFELVFRYYVSTPSPWSGPEGGFANGTAYAEYTLDYMLQIWPALAQVTGVNLFDKPWARGFLQYFMYFTPPGSQTHVFGDGQERAPETKFVKAYAQRYASPAAAWYARNLVGSEDPLTLLREDFPLPVAKAPPAAPPAAAALFPSIGWTAMHSDLGDRGRSSLYFKSSPYGAFNHSHGDQNSLVLTVGGTPLLSATGWYDFYGSPLWQDWYRQTKAANGITFDGGIGQRVDGYAEPLTRNGRIVAFSTTPERDYVVGDASAAYGGVLTKALRHVWYLRGLDQVVVWDQLAARAPHRYEWNVHAPAALQREGAAVAVRSQGRSVCIRPIGSPDLVFETPAGPPPKPGTVEAHGRFVQQRAALQAEFLMLLDVGCRNLPLQWQAGSGVLKVGEQTLTLPR